MALEQRELGISGNLSDDELRRIEAIFGEDTEVAHLSQKSAQEIINGIMIIYHDLQVQEYLGGYLFGKTLDFSVKRFLRFRSYLHEIGKELGGANINHEIKSEGKKFRVTLQTNGKDLDLDIRKADDEFLKIDVSNIEEGANLNIKVIGNEVEVFYM